MIPTSTQAHINVVAGDPQIDDTFAVFLHKQAHAKHPEVLAIPPKLREIVIELLKSGRVTGKSNELTVQLVRAGAVKHLLVVGLGNIEEFSCECLREAGAIVARAARKHKEFGRIALLCPPLPKRLPGRPGAAPAGDGIEAGVDAIATGLMLAAFDWAEYRGTAAKKKHDPHEYLNIDIIVPPPDFKRARAAVERAVVIARGQNFARTIAARPGNEINPPELASIATKMAREAGLDVRVLDEKQMAKLGMGGILAVGAGSSRTPPRMIVLQHRPGGIKGARQRAKAGKRDRPLLVIGKAVTFDTGGISIKPAEKMGRMVFDKCGAMTVLGLMYAAAKLRLPVPIVGILAAAENHISETAYRPGDLLRMYNGVTVEVTNTDAEGRLVLGDALAWGIETYKPSAVIDLATLTGGCVVALGHIWAALFSNSDELAAELAQSADNAGEKVWRMPMGEEVREMLKSDFADIINSAGRVASPLTGAAFLSYFIPGKPAVPWVHLDIAGVADTEKKLPYYDSGATGWGVRTLVNWVTSRAKG